MATYQTRWWMMGRVSIGGKMMVKREEWVVGHPSGEELGGGIPNGED